MTDGLKYLKQPEDNGVACKVYNTLLGTYILMLPQMFSLLCSSEPSTTWHPC